MEKMIITYRLFNRLTKIISKLNLKILSKLYFDTYGLYILNIDSTRKVDLTTSLYATKPARGKTKLHTEK